MVVPFMLPAELDEGIGWDENWVDPFPLFCADKGIADGGGIIAPLDEPADGVGGTDDDLPSPISRLLFTIPSVTMSSGRSRFRLDGDGPPIIGVPGILWFDDGFLTIYCLLAISLANRIGSWLYSSFTLSELGGKNDGGSMFGKLPYIENEYVGPGNCGQLIYPWLSTHQIGSSCHPMQICLQS